MRVPTVRPLLHVFTLIFLFLNLLPTTSFAYSLFIPSVNIADQAWFIGAGGGIARIHFSNGHTSVDNGSLFLPPMNQDTYSINTPTTGIAQINAGYIAYNGSKYFAAFSAYIQYRHYFTSHISGSVEQYTLPEFENYNYKVRYEADLFTINGKVGLVQLNQFIPYISAGIGFIINHVNDYTESPKPDITARISPTYQGKSNTNLAYTLGAGIDFLINKCMTITLGYDHVFQGNTTSGQGLSTWSSASLNFGDTNLDTVFLSVTTYIPQI